MRAAMEPARRCRSCAPPTCVNAFGSCRLCLVEIEGRAGTPASCTTPVAAGHEGPHPDRAAARAAPRRDGALHLRSSARLPDLRRQRRLRIAGHGGRGRACARCATAMPVRIISSAGKKDKSNPYFTYDPSKCIVCSRCVRACEEVQGTFALTIDGRGFGSRVSPGMARILPRSPNACRAAPACRPARPRR